MFPMSIGMAVLSCRHLLVALSCAVIAPQAAPAQIPGYTLETIALELDPGPDGGVIGNFFSARNRCTMAPSVGKSSGRGGGLPERCAW